MSEPQYDPPWPTWLLVAIIGVVLIAVWAGTR